MVLISGAVGQNPAQPDEVDKVVEITGDVSSGYGSVISMDGKTYIATTTRVLGGNSKLSIKTIAGKELKSTKIALAPNSELVFIEIEGMEGLPVAEDFGTAATEREDFLVLTFADDKSGVVEFRGRLSKIGDFLIEGRSTTTVEHSGSPVVHRKTRQLLGVVANFEVADMNSLQANVPAKSMNQLIYRVDNTGPLVPTTWGSYLAETKQLKALRLRSERLLDAAVEIFKKRYRVEPTRAEADRYKSEDKAIQRCLDDFADGYRPNASATVNDANRESFHRAVLWTMTADVNKIQPAKFTGYHKTEIAEVIADRKALEEWVEGQSEEE